MRQKLTALLIIPGIALAGPAFAAKKAAKPAPAKADQRKKPAKTLTIITQYRLEWHRKDLPNLAAAGCGGRGDFNCRVDDHFQQTTIAAKQFNSTTTGLLGGIWKYNMNEDKSDNVTWLIGASRVISKKLSGSAMWVSNNRFNVLENAQTAGDSDTIALSLNYKAMVKKKGMRDAIGTSLSFAFDPGMSQGGTLTPKVDWSHDFSKKLTSVVDFSPNFSMASKKNRTSGTTVASRNSLNTYGLTLKYQLTKKLSMDSAFQIKDFATGPSDNVFRVTVSRIY